MRIIPVVDLKNGSAVHAIGGNRAEYRPLTGIEPGPRGVRALVGRYRDEFGASEVYLADLDAIGGAPTPIAFYQELRNLGIRLWLDAGIGTAAAARLLSEAADVLIIGLETLETLEDLASIVAVVGCERLAFSLDLRDGRPIRGANASWIADRPDDYVEQAARLGIRRFILLDLARVGTGGGTGTNALLGRLLPLAPSADWVVGGGMRSIDDILEAAKAGATGALIGTALHDGRIRRLDISGIQHNR